MILDSSAVVAIILRESDYAMLLAHLEGTVEVGIGTPTLAETGIVLTARLGMSGRTLLARFLQESGLAVLPFEDRHWRTAIDAFLRFGKGRHPAALNFGDCLTYATARVANRELLALGGDFARTDLALVT